MVGAAQTMTRSAVRFSRLLWIGIFCNLLFCLPALIYPAGSLALMGFPPAPAIWLRYSAQVLLMLTLFQVPVALDPLRYSVFASLCVVARFAGFLFFTIVAARPAYRQYWIFAAYDLAFLVPLTVFLRAMNSDQASRSVGV